MRIPTTVSDAYVGSISPVREKVEKFNEKFDVASMLPRVPGGGSIVQSTGPTQGGRRLACRPVFAESESPINVGKTLLPSQMMARADFDSTMEFLGHRQF